MSTVTGAPYAATLTVDLGAICANYRLLRSRLGATACAAVVKADAYGLGAAAVAPALAAEGCRTFFVAHLDEALALRPLLPEAEIFVLNGLAAGAEPECAPHQVTPVLNSLAQVDAWAALGRRLGRAVPAALQVDSGMSRLGLGEAELDKLAASPERLDGIQLRLVMSHLACAERQDHPMNREQPRRFVGARLLSTHRKNPARCRYPQDAAASPHRQLAAGRVAHRSKVARRRGTAAAWRGGCQPHARRRIRHR
jgi:alanine racemase